MNMIENKMGTKPVLSLIFSMAIPAMISMLIYSLYNIVDSYFVSLISEKALRAVSIIFPVQILIISLGVGLGVGTSAIVSRKLGNNSFHNANLTAHQGFLITFAIGILFAITGIFLSRPFLKIMTSDFEVFSMGLEYMSIIYLFANFSLLELVFEKSVQATGQMIIPMISQTTGAVINMILDPVLIFGLFGFPELRIKGAAIATILGQFSAAMICFCYIAFKSEYLKIKISNFIPKRKIIYEILKIGTPSILLQSASSILLVGLNLIVSSISEIGLTVIGIYFKLESFVFLPVFGLTQGLLPIVSYNFGAKNKNRIDLTIKYGNTVALIIMVTGTLIFQIFPSQLLSIFSANDEMLKIGIPALRIISLAFPFAAFGICSSIIFQAFGRGMISLLISILRQLVLILPLSYIFSFYGLNKVWWSFPLSDFMGFFLYVFFLKKLYSEIINNLN